MEQNPFRSFVLYIALNLCHKFDVQSGKNSYYEANSICKYLILPLQTSNLQN